MCCSRYCYYNCAYFLFLFQKKILIILCLVILLVILVIIIGSALGVTLWRPQHAKPNAEQPIVCLATPTQPASRSQLRLVDSLSRVRAHVRDGKKPRAHRCAPQRTHTHRRALCVPSRAILVCVIAVTLHARCAISCSVRIFTARYRRDVKKAFAAWRRFRACIPLAAVHMAAWRHRLLCSMCCRCSLTVGTLVVVVVTATCMNIM